MKIRVLGLALGILMGLLAVVIHFMGEDSTTPSLFATILVWGYIYTEDR